MLLQLHHITGLHWDLIEKMAGEGFLVDRQVRCATVHAKLIFKQVAEVKNLKFKKNLSSMASRFSI